MNKDFEQQDRTSAKLSTASLAHVDEKTTTDKDAARATSAARSRDLDQRTADEETRSVQPAISSRIAEPPAKQPVAQNQSTADTGPIRLPNSTVNATENEQPTQLFSEQES